MSDTQLDVYAVAVGLRYYEHNDFYLKAGDLVTIIDKHKVVKDGMQIGSIAKQDTYYEEAFTIMDTLLNDNIHALAGDDYVFCDGSDFDLYQELSGEVAGKVVYADGKRAIIYLMTAGEDYIYEVEDDYVPEINWEDFCYDLCECVERKTDLACEPARKEETQMDNVFGKLGFGKCTDTRFALSINGLAVRQTNGKYVVYNKENNEFVDASDMLINIKDALFVLPATEINEGDTVLHEGKPYYIVDVNRNEIKAVSYEECTQTVLIPKTTMFGLKYFTKVFSFFGDNFAATGELFNNPMMLMALMGDSKDGDLSKLMLLSSLSKGDLGSNPMLLSMLMKDDSKSDFSTFALMSMLGNGTNPFAPKAAKKKAETKE
jgi:hypothetical protein